MTALSMQFESAVITPDMYDRYPGGQEAFFTDLGKQLPDQLVLMARTNHGLELNRSVKQITVTRKKRLIPGNDDIKPYYVYKLVASAEFTPTRCVPSYDFHLPRHSRKCPAYGSHQ